MKLSRNKTKWTTYDGVSRFVKDLADDHLANILWFFEVEVFVHHPTYKLMQKEAKLRGLSDSFLERAPIPYVGRDGKWHRWDSRMCKDSVISKNKAKRYG